MSALIPSQAVCLLYRRYLKSAYKIQNVTVRMLLLQQIRHGFRRNRNIGIAAAQRELVKQSQQDLNVLEDPRLSRTLYINKLGMVSCLDWEVRRTEYHMSPRAKGLLYIYLFCGFATLGIIFWFAEPVENTSPELFRMVGAMASRLEGSTPEDVRHLREQQILSGIERKHHRLSLEERVLSTFDEAPASHVSAPTMRYPDGIARQPQHLHVSLGRG